MDASTAPLEEPDPWLYNDGGDRPIQGGLRVSPTKEPRAELEDKSITPIVG